MRAINDLFAKHPKAVGETYFQHMWMAFSFGIKMLLSGLACLVHGVFPFLWEAAASKTVSKLHNEIVTHRNHRATEKSTSEQLN